VVAYLTARLARAELNTTHQENRPKMHRTIAPQQGHMAAGARPCAAAGHAYQGNAWVSMTVSSFELVRDIATKRPARHLGAPPT
jgi:hypothetical protein